MIGDFDFEQDLLDIIRGEYAYLGIRFNEKKSSREHLTDFCTIGQKIILAVPRKVLISQPLQSSISNHPKRKAIEKIVEMLRDGKNVNIFQSEKLFQSKGHDQLLYEWKIYHFHLSTKIKNGKRFVERTNELLFVFIENDNAALLDIGDHNSQFAQVRWLEILHDYFPELIEKYIQGEDVLPVGNNYKDEERSQMWEGGLSPFLTRVRDKIYYSPGLGRATSGHSILAMKQANEISRWIYILQDQFSKYSLEIIQAFELPNKVLKPKLVLSRGKMCIIDKDTGFKYLDYLNTYEVNPIYYKD